MRPLLVQRLGVLVLVAGLACACTDVERSEQRDPSSVPPPVDQLGVGIVPGADAVVPRTLFFGDVEVVQMSRGEDASAPVALTVRSIRLGDDAAVDRARSAGRSATRHSYYVDVTLTFEGYGVVEVTPFLTLAYDSREMNTHALPLALDRPFAPCPGTGDGLVLRRGESVDACVVFPGPRPERVRGVSMLDANGAPTWEGPVS